MLPGPRKCHRQYMFIQESVPLLCALSCLVEVLTKRPFSNSIVHVKVLALASMLRRSSFKYLLIGTVARCEFLSHIPVLMSSTGLTIFAHDFCPLNVTLILFSTECVFHFSVYFISWLY